MDLLTSDGIVFDEDVLPWTRRVDLSKMDMILLPVNVGEVHWALMAAYPRYHVVQYFDSMGNDGTRALKIFRAVRVISNVP